MFGHACDEPIALVAAHPCDSLFLVCTYKINLTLLDLSKNRSLRTFGINTANLNKEQLQIVKSSPIGLFFIDNLTCRTLHSMISSTIQNLPSDKFIAVVFPKGMFTFDYTCIDSKFIPFDNITATYAAQAPDAIILCDQSGAVYNFSLITSLLTKIHTTTAPPLGVFVGASKGEPYGIIIPTTSGVEFVRLNNQSPAPLNIEVGRNFAFDPYTSTLFSIIDKRSVKVFRVALTRVECIGECSFSAVAFGESKGTNYNLQQIAPCFLPYSPPNKPLFYALCDQNALFICGVSKPLMRIENFPPPQIRKLNGSFMAAHPTNSSNIIIAYDNNLLIVDISAHLPTVVPSLPIPKALRSQLQYDGGLFNVIRRGDLTIVVERCSKEYHVYDNSLLKKEIQKGKAYDIVPGPGKNFAVLNISPEKKNTASISIYSEPKKPQDITVQVPDGYSSIQRLISFGDYLAVICSENETDLSRNPQKRPKSTALAWRWTTKEPVPLEIFGTSMACAGDGYVAAGSPNMYALYKVEDGKLHYLATRNIAPISMRFYKGSLFVISNEGLYIDDMKSAILVAVRYSHLTSADKKGTRIPIRASCIMKIEDKSITLCDNNGIESVMGMPERVEVPIKINLIDKLAAASDALEKMKEAFPKASEEDKRHILLLMLRNVDWSVVEEYLTVSEKAGTEMVLQNGTENIEKFKAMLSEELELDM
ncbi:hypothetical protein TVAG_371870 [Trichomonas vaginalis G3]|uniref:Uncharacterized protein n=1 Tax=Trichomonas vaginalis (strain ATCC PRA-98 / G3) TaxID=412133 RepID=A2E0V8_TRIV3|nr:hypothetical protein TVAGG3_0326120 [Trichomonas vaginalis G3]EAY13713.1 hypothetical protein TVAG_371870 [Trichomonas vaginalis G3]KAI5529645.1 hypothetical protein TVAGG3_0326120 [Trichomonas vaginalis G3]|eukprot:XP_001325936.1 hypothetical protein [Trichomonas vaginalis G3]